MPKVIGLTGGIATGKSTVSELLSAHGFKIVDADIAARQAVAKGSHGLEQVREAFGDDAITEEGEMDRAYVGDIVLNNLRRELNSIILFTPSCVKLWIKRKRNMWRKVTM